MNGFLMYKLAESIYGDESQRGTGGSKKRVPSSTRCREEIEAVSAQIGRAFCKGSFHLYR